MFRLILEFEAQFGKVSVSGGFDALQCCAHKEMVYLGMPQSYCTQIEMI